MTKSRSNGRTAHSSSTEGSSELWRPTPVALAVSLALGMWPAAAAWAQQKPLLPVICSGAVACGGRGFDPSRPSYAPDPSVANKLVINQGTAASAIFNWQSFNIATGTTVQFIQPSANAVALNRIFDNKASTIDGALKANGQIYLINPNGILFGTTARVDVGGLIASTLNLSDSRVTRGLLSETDLSIPVFSTQGDLTAAPDATDAGKIRVMPGAQIYAAGRNETGTVVSAGRVFLFAPDVSNGGEIKVDGGGQVILAAGSKVFLGSTSDPTLRGLLVEVADGLKVENTGSVTTARGNITMMGLAVNQTGTLTATSAIRENGSIRLIAREVSGAANNASNTSPVGALFAASKTGVVTLGSGSATRVALDASDTGTAALNDASAAAARSSIVIEGGAVNIGGAEAGKTTLVEAHGGDIAVSARQDVTTDGYKYGALQTDPAALLGAQNDAAIVTVGANAVLDASGLKDVTVDGSRNFIYIERLTSNDMRDTPLQRDGFLRGKGVYMNVAVDNAFIDNSARRAAVVGTQAERNAVGGTVALRAEGAVNLAKGSVVDVSGGSTNTTAGQGRTSQLLTSTGQVVDIMKASASQQYVGFADQYTASVSSPDEGISTSSTYQAPKFSAVGGFSSGMAAGSVEITAPRGTVDGSLVAHTTVTPLQGATPPVGGELRIGSAAGSTLALDAQADLARASILLGNDSDALRAGLSDEQLQHSMVLNTDTLRRNGFSRMNLTSDGQIVLASGSALDLGVGGQFSAKGNLVAVNSSISAAGGSITLAERQITAVQQAAKQSAEQVRDALADTTTVGNQRGTVALGSGVQLSTAGLWANDSQLAAGQVSQQPVMLNGGSISVSGRVVDVSQAGFDVSAGARLAPNGAVTGGKAGSLSVGAADSKYSNVVTAGQLVLGSDFAGRIAGFGVTGGGSLSISAPNAAVLSANAADAGNATWLDAKGLGTRGFSRFSFSAFEHLDVAAGTSFRPEVSLLQPTADLRFAPSSAHLVDLVQPQLPALPTQPLPTQISLGTTDLYGGVTTVGTGAVVDAGTLGSVSMVGGSQAVIDGSLMARGGAVSVALLKRGANDAFTSAEIDSRTVHLGETGKIDVSGISRVLTGVDGRRSGDVLDAGRVDLSASYGSLTVDAKASIDAQGAVDRVTPKGAVAATQSVASAGGVLSLQADVGLSVSKDAVVNAGGGDASALGGRLSLQLQRVDPGQLSGWSTAAQTSLLASHQLLIDDSVMAAPTAGQGQITSTLINQGGFDQVWLASSDTVALGKGVALTTKGSLSIDAQALEASGNSARSLNSKYVSIGAGLLGQAALSWNGQQANPPATGGDASLTMNADNIDLVGRFALNGFGDASLNAKADVRGIGLAPGSKPAANTTDTRPTGEFKVGGNLNIQAAQVYPATYTDFTFSSNAAPDAAGQGVITVTRATDAGVPLAPLSAGGKLAIKANDIVVDGRIAAPLGSIDLQGQRSVVVSGEAELSAQGVGTVPFGTVASGSSWTYSWGTGSTAIADAQGIQVPDKGVRIQAPTVDVQTGAKVNVAGGGQLLGTEFVAGPGGSFDMTQNFPQSTDGTGPRNSLFALLPSRGTALAAFDPQIYRDLSLNGTSGASSTFTFGQTITLGAGSGLPAGTYTVLPARYAVLPGAFAVQPASGYTDLLPSQAIAEAAGTVIVAGRLGLATSEGNTTASRWSGYRVFNGTQFRALSELKDYNGDSFITPFAAVQGVAPRLARDAGALAIGADSIRLAGDISAAPASGGRGADVSLSAPHIEVTPVAAAATQPGDVLQLSASQLNALGAETLLLGATASDKRQDGGATLSTQTAHAAQTVNLQGSTALEAGEVILTASELVSTGVGSAVNSSAAAPATRTLKLSGDGATLWVSASHSDALSLLRSDTQGTQGSLSLGIGSAVGGHSGTSLRAGNAVFDASLQQQFGAGLDLRAEGFSLSGTSINLGEVPEGTPGLSLSSDLLAKFSSASRLTLASAGGFNAYGSTQIGGIDGNGQPLLDVLRLKGQGIQGQGGASDSVQLSARHLVLDNSQPNAQVAVAPGTGLGSLTLRAIDAGTNTGDVSVAGVFAANGFDQVDVQAASALRFKGAVAAAATLDAGAARLKVDAGTITAQRGVHAALSTTGTLTVSSTAAAPTTRTQEAGAMLALSGSAVDFGGRISLPGGVVSLNATGTDAGSNVTLRSGSRIDAAGQTQLFGPAGIATTADLSAGSITLASQAGSVLAQGGSVLDLSGAGTSGDAGSLTISAANGDARLQGSLLTAPGTLANGASLAVDAKSLANLSEIASALNKGNGNTEARSINLRARQGDVVLGANDILNAEKITLAADGGAGASDGSVRINGKLLANGTALGNGNGGRVQVYTHNAIELGAGGEIDAMSRQQGDVAADGGQVMLSARITNDPLAPSDAYAVTLQPGARIKVSGHDGATQHAVQGQVTLRARRIGNDVDVAQLPADAITGGKTIVEGVVLEEFTGDKTFTGTTAAPMLGTEQKLLQGYMSAANQDAMATRLLGTPTTYATSSGFSLRPGLEIRSTGNLTLGTKTTTPAAPDDVNSQLNLAGTATNGSFNWRYGGTTTATSDPMALTLRAGGNLALNESISDGFASAATSAAVFAQGDSARYGFTAGSDLTASNARQTNSASTGSLTVGRATDNTARGAVIRTGTGSISMDAARDVVLMNNSTGVGATQFNQGQVVYTAGVQVGDLGGVTFPSPRPTVIKPVLTTGGGDVNVAAGRDIDGGGPNDLVGSGQSVTQWFWRGGMGTAGSPSVQWINFSQFQQNWGVLGGGNLALEANGNIVRANASVASTGYVAGDQKAQYNRGALDVRAGGSILQGMFYNEAGQFDVKASSIDSAGPGAFNTTRLAQGGNSINVQVREQAVLDQSFNPTAYAPSKVLTPVVSGADDYRTTYFTYAPDSRLSVRVDAGNLLLAQADTPPNSAGLLNARAGSQGTDSLQYVTAPNLDLIAFGGKLSTASAAPTLFPSSNSSVRALADGNISDLGIFMSQADPLQIPTIASPYKYVGSAVDAHALDIAVNSFGASPTALHASDTDPSVFVSRNGSIANLTLNSAEATEIHAAGTLSSSDIQISNQSAASISRISAGQAIDFSGGGWIRIYGAGAAEAISGGAINLGDMGVKDFAPSGIISKGNLANPNLPAQGASLLVAAGTGLAPDGFALRPDYLNLVTQFLQNNAFASTGALAGSLNDQVLAILKKPGAEEGSLALAKLLEAGLAQHGAIDSTQVQALANQLGVTDAGFAVGSLRLASAIQEVANTRFVQTHNTDTFAAGYAAFNDLFPTLANTTAGLNSFVSSNPFAVSTNAASLRAQVIDGLRSQGGAAAAVADALALGVANPASVNDPNSTYSRAVAALTPDQLQTGGRALLAQTLAVAGTDLDRLRAADKVDAGAGTPYARSLTDLAAAYAPLGLPGANDLGMAASDIKVEQTGQLSLLAPRGSIHVGQPVAVDLKNPADLGLFTLGGGSITAMVRDNVDVYRSRVFTVAGGDIALWSSLGNIDAGRGKTDAAVVPPPRLVPDPHTGIPKLDLGGSVTGSGIGALVSDANQPAGDVTLVAPKGFIDAGEAGIRADRGKVTLGADVVLNTGAIKAAGGVEGGKVVVAPPAPVPATAGGNQANDAVEQTQRNLSAQQSEAQERAKKERRKRVTGEFIGFGDD